MRALVAWLVHGRVPEIALALGVGYAAVTLAESAAGLATSILAQHVGRNPFGDDALDGLVDFFSAPYYLNFSLGDTVIFYGQVLSAALAFGLVAVASVAVTRRGDRQLGICPFCASRIPYESTHCAYCGSAVAPGEP